MPDANSGGAMTDMEPIDYLHGIFTQELDVDNSWEYIADILTDRDITSIRERYTILGIFPVRRYNVIAEMQLLSLAVWVYPLWKEYEDYEQPELGFA